MQTFLILLNIILSLGVLMSLYLAIGAYETLFWAVGSAKYGVNFRHLLFWGLLNTALFSALLVGSGFALLKSPELVFRYFGALTSLTMSVILIMSGYQAFTQAYNFESNLELFCQGGFPQFGGIAQTYVDSFYQVSHHYIDLNMCRPNRCSCQKPEANFTESYDFSGTYVSFKDCYHDMVNKGQLRQLPLDFIKLIELFESEHNCNGLCLRQDFYFRENIT